MFKAQGYAIDDEENEMGLYCIAAPILNDAQQVVGAISCDGPKERIIENKNIPGLIKQNAYFISKAMGFNEKWSEYILTVISYGEVMGVFSINDGKFVYQDRAQFDIAGAEVNTMIGLAKLGLSSQFITAVGNDAIGDAILYQLNGEAVGTHFLTTLNNFSTGLMTKERGVSIRFV